MQEQERHDLTITGTGLASGGQFHRVRITGEARFEDTVTCAVLKCTGTAVATADLHADNCSINGTLDIGGSAAIKEAKINGTLGVTGNLHTTTVKSNGETRVGGHVTGDDVQLEGVFHIKGNCEAEHLQLKGLFTIKGLLNAGHVELALHSRCNVQEIGGTHIEIRRGTSHLLKRMVGAFFLPGDFYEGTLTADTIEGDDVYVEYTHAHVVRGNRVRIGPGCHIRRVEYAAELEQDESSQIEHLEQT